jgi:transcriptional regulator GlxA family with amidase domain
VAPDVETKRIVLFTLPPVREMDLVGAVDVFTSANRAVGGKPLYDVKVVSAEKARADRRIDGMCGLSLQCHADFHRFRGQIDTLLVPGGVGVEERKPEAAALKWLQKTANIATGSAPQASENEFVSNRRNHGVEVRSENS